MKTKTAFYLCGFLWTVGSAALSPSAAASLDDVVAGKVEKAAGGFLFIEGPVWHRDGFLLFSDIDANRIYKWTGLNQREVWRANSGNSNGLTFDREGRLIACEHTNRRVSRTASDGTVETVAATFEGKKFNSPNDCAVRSDGRIFFTDPSYGLGSRKREIAFDGVYAVAPGGEPLNLVKDFAKPNGIALSPDESLLYVADTDKDHVRAFDLAEDGTVSNGRVFVSGVNNPDGMKVDADGRLYVTAANGVAVYDAGGARLGVIACPEQPANCAFGGPDNKTLFITARKGLYKVDLRVAGIPVWPVRNSVDFDLSPAEAGPETRRAE